MNTDQDNLKNAFRLVNQIFIEVALLIQDFESVFIDKGDDFISLHNGHEIGTESSNSLNVGGKWLKKYVMRYFLPKSKKESFEHLLGIGVAYNFDHQKDASPKLILGIIENDFNEGNHEKYYYWWIPFLYDSKEMHKFEPEITSVSDLESRTWYSLDPSPSAKLNLPLFGKGYLYFTDLLDVQSFDDVKKLADELREKYKSLYSNET